MTTLRYHQATYDLLTQDYIDPAPAIRLQEKSAQQYIESYARADVLTQEKKEELLDFRDKVLTWTKLDLHRRNNRQKTLQSWTRWNARTAFGFPPPSVSGIASIFCPLSPLCAGLACLV